jgi:hypothetical protein
MTEQNGTEIISRRRAFSFFGLAALSLAVSPIVLTVSDAEAQQPSTQNPQTETTTTPQTGTQRRQERRTERTERRQERRTARTERRTERRTARTERRTARHEGRTEGREQRHGTTPSTSSTPQKP